MARYQAGNLVAFVNKFERCGRIVFIDEKGKGYKINTGHDVIYAYEKEIVLISSNAPIRPEAIIEKIDRAGKQLPTYTSDFRAGLIKVLTSKSDTGNLFANYVSSVSEQVLAACLKAISNIKIEKFEINIIKSDISGAIIEKLLPLK